MDTLRRRHLLCRYNSIFDEFLQHISSVSSNIKFTFEIEMISQCHSWMFKLPATLTTYFEQPYIKNPRTPTDIYNLTLITLATTSLLLPRAYLMEIDILAM